MLNFKPFKGIRIKDENVEFFPTYSPERYTEEQIKSKLRSSAPSYMDIIKPTFFKGESPLENRFKKVRKRYDEYLNENLFETDPSSIYIYEQKKRNGEVFKGVIGLVSADDFKDNKIKIPEKVDNDQKQKIFNQFLDITYLQTNPVLLSYESNSKLEVMMDLEVKSKPIIQITDEFGISHRVWRIDNRLKIAQFKDAIEKLPALYLADGNYRVMGAIAHSEKIKSKAKTKDFLFSQNHNVMALITSSHSLRIYEYNILLNSLNGLSKEDFFLKLEEHFTINDKGEQPYFPSHKHHISMYIDSKFYGLYIKHELRGIPEGLGNIDSYLLHKYVLEPILGIKQESINSQKQLSYIRGTNDIKGIKDIKLAIDTQDYTVGFGFHPISYTDLKLVSDLNLKMPSKSMFAEPKLLSGLIIFDMK